MQRGGDPERAVERRGDVDLVSGSRAPLAASSTPRDPAAAGDLQADRVADVAARTRRLAARSRRARRAPAPRGTASRPSSAVHRLLAQLEVERGRAAGAVDGPGHRPGAVGVDADQHLGRRPRRGPPPAATVVVALPTLTLTQSKPAAAPLDASTAPARGASAPIVALTATRGAPRRRAARTPARRRAGRRGPTAPGRSRRAPAGGSATPRSSPQQLGRRSPSAPTRPRSRERRWHARTRHAVVAARAAPPRHSPTTPSAASSVTQHQRAGGDRAPKPRGPDGARNGTVRRVRRPSPHRLSSSPAESSTQNDELQQAGAAPARR